MNPFVGLFIATLGLIGLFVVITLKIKAEKQYRLYKALQAYVDELVELYDNEGDEPRA